MALQKNVAGQKWRVFAFNITTGDAVTGDAANITAKISKDGGASTATNDVNPTEDEEGYYDFDLTQAESDMDTAALIPVSATSNVQVIGVPGVLDAKAVNVADLAITASGGVGVNWGNVQNPATVLNLSGTTIGTLTALSTAAILSIWNQLTAALATASTIGKLLVDNINATISSRSTFNAATDAVANVTLVATTTVNTDQRGTDGVDTAPMRGTDGVDTAAMRGTNLAALAVVATEARLAELDAANLPADVDEILTRLPAALVDNLSPTQVSAILLASAAGRIVDITTDPMIIRNPDGTQTRISATPNRNSITLTFVGV